MKACYNRHCGVLWPIPSIFLLTFLSLSYVTRGLSAQGRSLCRADYLGSDYFDESQVIRQMESEISGYGRRQEAQKRSSPIKESARQEERESLRSSQRNEEMRGVKFSLVNGESYSALLNFPEKGIQLKEPQGPGIVHYIPLQELQRLEFYDWQQQFSRRRKARRRKNGQREEQEYYYYLPRKARAFTHDGRKISGFIESLKWMQLNVYSEDAGERTVLRTYFRLAEGERSVSLPVLLLQALNFTPQRQKRAEGVVSRR